MDRLVGFCSRPYLPKICFHGCYDSNQTISFVRPYLIIILIGPVPSTLNCHTIDTMLGSPSCPASFFPVLIGRLGLLRRLKQDMTKPRFIVQSYDASTADKTHPFHRAVLCVEVVVQLLLRESFDVVD